MNPFLVVAIIGMAVSAVKQWQAGNTAQKIATQNARNIRAEAAEEARRLADDQSRARGRTRAGMAASGATLGDTNLLYLQTQQDMQEDELTWLLGAADSRAKIASAEGAYAKQAAHAQAIGTVAQAASLGYSAGLGGGGTAGTYGSGGLSSGMGTGNQFIRGSSGMLGGGV